MNLKKKSKTRTLQKKTNKVCVDIYAKISYSSHIKSERRKRDGLKVVAENLPGSRGAGNVKAFTGGSSLR